MIPKKYSEIIKPLAEELNVNEQLIAHVVEAYWKEVRRSLVNCKGNNIVVAGLGTFIAKPWKVKEVMENYKTTVNRYKETIDAGVKISFQKFAHMKDSETRIDILQNLTKMIADDEVKRKNKKKLKYEKYTKQNLEG